MVNSGSEGESRRAAADYMQVKSGGSSTSTTTTTNTGEGSQQSQSPITASGGAATTPRKSDSTLTADVNNDDDVLLRETRAAAASTAVEPPNDLNNGRPAAGVLCRVPLDKVQGVLKKPISPPPPPVVETPPPKAAFASRKVLCLYCDRTFVSTSLRQKHVERSHSTKQFRRVSSRRQQNHFTSTPCVYCDKLTATEHTLKELFEHLILNHSQKYYGCLPCEDRFLNTALLAEHNASAHRIFPEAPVAAAPAKAPTSVPETTPSKATSFVANEDVPVKMTRSMRLRKELMAEAKPAGKMMKKLLSKDLRGNKKLAVKSSALALKRSKRLQAKVIVESSTARRQRRTKNSSGDRKKLLDQQHQQQSLGTASGSVPSGSSGVSEKSSKALATVNPYPEFDSFFRVKKITDHSIDNLKISSLTFDDVFDKAFFNRIRCNIQENLLHHIDGKLFKNEESESRISNFEKNSSPQEMTSSNLENYGCELSLNAVTPAVSLLSTQQFGEDLESQIEYGAKPASKKAKQQTKSGIDQEVVHYKYFTRRKYQASILEHKENRDLSKLDMWTQYVIKNRQQKIIDDKKTPDEVRDYVSGEEYKTKVRREELNRILDRRGPFEDLREEASKKAAMDKLSEAGNDVNEESFSEIRELLTSMVNKVFEMVEESNNSVENQSEVASSEAFDRRQNIPSYLNLRHTSTLENDSEIDKSDRIALICSSQETENFELPSNTVRDKNEKVELTGEWARSRIFVCAACGLKLQNMKQLLEHKNIYHQYVWVQHYEMVGNQSELYRHLSIPGLGKVGALEDNVQCKLWKRSEARLCSKCGKQCNSLGELHRHILECGGDWTWMLARKKCKYRPFGAKSRRKRRGLVKRICTQKTEPSEKKIYKKAFDGPRPKPSDAETIQRMLANLPPKRATRKIMCLKDGLTRNTKQKQQQNPHATNQAKLKCGKMIHNSKVKTVENKNISQNKEYKVKNNFKRSLRSLNKVLASRVLDTNSTLLLKRKLKNINTRQTRQSIAIVEREEEGEEEKEEETNEEANVTEVTVTEEKPAVVVEEKETPPKVTPVKVVVGKKKKKTQVEGEQKEEIEVERRTSPRNEKNTSAELLPEPIAKVKKMNIKRFFPVRKKKSSQKSGDAGKPAKRKSTEPEVENKQIGELAKVGKKSTFSSLMRTLSLRKKKTESKTKNKFVEAAVPEETELKRKRKFGDSFRNAVKKIKKLKVGHETEKPTETPVHFLEETKTGTVKPAAELEKIIIPVIEEPEKSSDPAVDNTSIPAPIVVNCSDEPAISGTIFDLHNENAVQAKGIELDTLKVETDESLKPQSSPIMVSPKPNKGKIRKQKGLNDCIAMLTSKLQQNVEESSSINSIFNLMPSTKEPEKQCILKVPSIKDHLKLTSVVEEVAALDLSCHSHQPPQPLLAITSISVVKEVENSPCEPETNIDTAHDRELRRVDEIEALDEAALKQIEAPVSLEVLTEEPSDLTTVPYETRKIGSSRKAGSKKTPLPPPVVLEIPKVIPVEKIVDAPVLELEKTIREVDQLELIQKKSKSRKIGQKRNKLPKRKDLLASKIDNLIAVEIKQRNGEHAQPKLFLETNLDSVFNTREVSLEIFDKPEKVAVLNEPLLLENKPIVSNRKEDNSKHDIVLDSEDELPLSSLLKIDGESLSAISEQEVDLTRKSKTKRKKPPFRTATTKSALLEKCMREKMLQLSGELHYCQDLMEEIENEIRRENDLQAMAQAETEDAPIPTIYDSVLPPENSKPAFEDRPDIENIVGAVEPKNTKKKEKSAKNNADISIEYKATEATEDPQVDLNVYDFTETDDATKQDHEVKKAETTKVNGEIKENNCEEPTNGRRRIARSAKAKALENILDDALALAELTESERNREVFQGSKKKDRSPKKSPTRKNKKREELVETLPELVEALPELDDTLPASLTERLTSSDVVTNEDAVMEDEGKSPQKNKTDQDLPALAPNDEQVETGKVAELKLKKSKKKKYKKQPKSSKKYSNRKNTKRKVLVKALPELHEALPELHETVSESHEALPESNEALLESHEALPESNEALPESNEALPELHEALPETREALPELHKALPETREALPESREILPESREPLPESLEPLSELREALSELNSTLSELYEPLPELHETLPELHNTLSELHETLPELDETVSLAEMRNRQKLEVSEVAVVEDEHQTNKKDQNLLQMPLSDEQIVQIEKSPELQSKTHIKNKKQPSVAVEVELVQSVSLSEEQMAVDINVKSLEVKSKKSRKNKKKNTPSVKVKQKPVLPSEEQMAVEVAMKPSEVKSKKLKDKKQLAPSAEVEFVQPPAEEQVTVNDDLKSIEVKTKKTRQNKKEIMPYVEVEEEPVTHSEAKVSEAQVSLEVETKSPELKLKKSKKDKKQPALLELQVLLPTEVPADEYVRAAEVKSKKTKKNKKASLPVSVETDFTKLDGEKATEVVELRPSASTDVQVVPQAVEAEAEIEGAVGGVHKSPSKAKKSSPKKGKKSDQIMPIIANVPEEVQTKLSLNIDMQKLVVEVDKKPKKSSSKKNKNLHKLNLSVELEKTNLDQSSILLETLTQQDSSLELPLEKQSLEFIDGASKSSSLDSMPTKSLSRKEKRKRQALSTAVEPVVEPLMVEPVVEGDFLPKPSDDAIPESPMVEPAPKRITRRSTVSLSEENPETVQSSISETFPVIERSAELLPEDGEKLEPKPEIEKKTKKSRPKKKNKREEILSLPAENSQTVEKSVVDEIVPEKCKDERLDSVGLSALELTVPDIETAISETPNVELNKKSISLTRKIRSFETMELSKSYEFEDEIPIVKINEIFSAPSLDLGKKSKKPSNKKDKKESVGLTSEFEFDDAVIADDQSMDETAKTSISKKSKRSPDKNKKMPAELSNPFEFEESIKEDAKVDEASPSSDLNKKSKKSPNKKNTKQLAKISDPFEFEEISKEDAKIDETTTSSDVGKKSKKSPNKKSTKQLAEITDSFEVEESSKEDGKIDETFPSSDLSKKSKKSPTKKNTKQLTEKSDSFELEESSKEDGKIDETFPCSDLSKKSKKSPNKKNTKQLAEISDPFEFEEIGKEDAKIDETSTSSDVGKKSKKSPNKKSTKQLAEITDSFELEESSKEDEKIDETFPSSDSSKKSKKSPTKKNTKQLTEKSDPFELEESSKEDEKIDETFPSSDSSKKLKKSTNKKNTKQIAEISDPFEFEESSKGDAEIDEPPSSDLSKKSKKSPTKKNTKLAEISDQFEFEGSTKEDAKIDETSSSSDLTKKSKKSPNKKNTKQLAEITDSFEVEESSKEDGKIDETFPSSDLSKKSKKSPNKKSTKQLAEISDPFDFEETSKDDVKIDETSPSLDLSEKSKKPPNKKTTKQLAEVSDPFEFEESDTEIGDTKIDETSSTPSLGSSKKSKKSPKKKVTKESAALAKTFEGTVVSLAEEETSQNLETSEILEDSLKRKSPDDEIESPLELRRSKRSSRKITSYNEAELAEQALEVVSLEKVIESEITSDVILKPEEPKEKPKMNSDELFDLLKATPNENHVLSKPPVRTFFNNFDEISDDFNDDNYDIFENILEKSMAVIEENLAADRSLPVLEMNLERDDVSIPEPLPLESELERPVTPKDIDVQMQEKQDIDMQMQEKLLGEEIESKLDSLTPVDLVPKTASKKNSKKNRKKKSDKVIHCEICNRSFRIDNLNKHQRTLVHISKLSEIEAREAELKAKKQGEDLVEITSDSSKNDLNLFEVLDNIESASKDDGRESPASFTINNQSLKLADIIDDVLNKPSLSKDDEKHNFSDIIMQNPDQPEIRRYKSLGERKSFDADQPQIVPKDPPPPPQAPPAKLDYFDSTRSNEAGTILEKQLTLLQNMIENRTNLSYIDDISISSAQSENNSLVEVESVKQNESLYANVVLKSDSFLKPTQYEEISEDSTNLRSYDDQKSRKALNRDEELFLECCSLLKSSSEVSNYSKKSNKLSKVLNNLDLKSAEEPDWLENKSFSRSADNFQDSSRIPTPLGDNFVDDESNSNTIASNWNMTYEDEKDKPSEGAAASRSFSFEEVLNDDDKAKDKKVVSKFGGVISKALHSFKSRQRGKKRNGIMSDDESSSSMDIDINKRTAAEELSDSSTTDSKKMLTKGAMKVFEGLKVSIPTEELDMKEVLNNCISHPPTKNPLQKSTSSSAITTTTTTTTTSKNPPKKLKLSTLSAELFSKITNKKKPAAAKISKKKSMDIDALKVHDIYDFEETQDNSDVFAKPDFRSFRNKKTEEPSKGTSDVEDGGDSLSFEASSTSSVSDLAPKKSKTEQNITKKKCMIMGRIFKNAAAKSRIEEEIREIPTADSAQLVEDFVRNCPKPAEDAQKKPKMTEEEMNKAFDMLLNGETTAVEKLLPPPVETKPVETQKKKSKVKYKKRSRGNADDETDDEFSLTKLTKKRTYRKNEDNSINLEQELKECIGVASRKSQRKCTSGKQNVLVEYWSSDESTFEIPEPVVPPKAAEKEKTFTDFVKPFDLIEKPVEKVSEPIVDEIVEEVAKATPEIKTKQKKPKPRDATDAPPTGASSNRRKRAAANPLYHWSSSSEDESSDLILVKPIRDETEDDDDRPVQHGWIVGDSPKKLVTMLAQAKGKKLGDVDSVKEQGKKRTTAYS